VSGFCVYVCLFCVCFLCMCSYFLCVRLATVPFLFFPSFFVCPIFSLVLALSRPAATTATTASRCPTHKCTRGILRTAWRSSSSSRKCFPSEKFSACCLRATLLSKPHEYLSEEVQEGWMGGWVGGEREGTQKKSESLVVDAARRPEEFILPLPTPPLMNTPAAHCS
jgi:hypothetical protein